MGALFDQNRQWGGDPDWRLTSLPLRELEAFSRSRLPVFLAFCLARIAREKSFLLQYTAQLGTEFDQSPRDSVLHSIGLSMHAAAGDVNHNIKFVQGVGCLQRPLDQHLVGSVE